LGLRTSEATTANSFFLGDAALAAWKNVIDAVHDGGARMGLQLWQAGALKSFLTQWQPGSPVESP
jgi:2,4-dienoyl-CoA reductase-like NADH-dependent reductase (Old Yellow Enzyme family)